MRFTSILAMPALAAALTGLAGCQPAPPPQPEPQALPAQPQFSGDECLSLVSQGLTALRRQRQGDATAEWQVQLQNRCPQGAPVAALPGQPRPQHRGERRSLTAQRHSVKPSTKQE